MFRITLLALALSGASWSLAQAGEQYVDATSYAASGYDVVSYFDLEQAPVGEVQPEPLPGSAAITAEWNGAVFAFATEANKATFLADPAAYAPQYDGHCAYGVTKGGKVPGNPTLWRIVDGKLYFNITKNVVGYWEEDIPGNLILSESNWPGIEPIAASSDRIPNFTSKAPLTN